MNKKRLKNDRRMYELILSRETNDQIMQSDWMRLKQPHQTKSGGLRSYLPRMIITMQKIKDII